MSMLAESRKRKKYVLLARGKPLYEDKNRLGTKLLEKMGWKEGKGLGPQEEGSKDFIRVRYKNDNGGFGYEERNDHWTQHEEGFNDLLSNLNKSVQSDVKEETTEEKGVASHKLKDCISGVSLEDQSKKSKARVHYQKFTKGKDLSQYSEKDLANIFGKKLKDEKENENQMVATGSKDERGNGEVQTINTGISVADYFKAKMEQLKRKNGISLSLVKTTEQDEDYGVYDKKKRTSSSENFKDDVEKMDTRKDTISSENCRELSPTFEKNRRRKLQTEEDSIANDELPKDRKSKKRRTETLEEGKVETHETEEGLMAVKEQKRKKKQSKLRETTEYIDEVMLKTKGEGEEEEEELCSKNTEQKTVTPFENEIPSNLTFEAIKEDLNSTSTDEKLSSKKKHKSKKTEKKVGRIDEAIEPVSRKIKHKKSEKIRDDLNVSGKELMTEGVNSTSTGNDLQKNMNMAKPENKNLANSNTAEVENTSETNDDAIKLINKIKSKKKEKHKRRNKDKSELNGDEAIVNGENINGEKIKNLQDPEKENESNLVTPEELVNKSKKKKKHNRRNKDKSELNGGDEEILLDGGGEKFDKSSNEGEESVKADTGDIVDSVSTAEDTKICDQQKADEKKKKKQAKANRKGEAEEPQKSGSVYTISSYCAEKFRNLDLGGFKGASLGEITGYGLSKDVRLEVRDDTPGDRERIMKLWKPALNNYGEKVDSINSSYRTYVKDVLASHKHKTKPPKLSVKSLQRKKVMTGI